MLDPTAIKTATAIVHDADGVPTHLCDACAETFTPQANHEDPWEQPSGGYSGWKAPKPANFRVERQGVRPCGKT